jgi:hypothetical protein
MQKLDINAVRARFEAYILTERSKSYLERNNPDVDSQHDYKNHFVQEAWESWCACAGVDNPAQFNPLDDTLTIFGVKYSVGLFQTLGVCPIGAAFRVVGRTDEELVLQSLEVNEGKILLEPVIPNPSHVHCETCETENCPGIRVREALPTDGPTPDVIVHARAEGRAEALELIKGVDAETFAEGDTYIGSHAIADTGDYGAHWNDDKLRELLQVDDTAFSMIDALAATYWTQQAYIDGLQVQLNGEWLPIGAAESEKDGRYILAWFDDLPRGLKIALSDPPTPWVAAVRWGGDASLWGMLGVGGLMPTRFKPIAGPNGQPVGHIRKPPAAEITS